MLSRSLLSATRVLIFALIVLSYPQLAEAQRHGGGMGGGIPGATGRPTGVDEKDDLKDFHRALAVQATSQQIADFQLWLKATDAAKLSLQRLLKPETPAGPESQAPITFPEISQLIDHSREEEHKFVDGFSSAQKAGLKDLLKKLNKADNEVEARQKNITAISTTTNAVDQQTHGENLSKSLSDFSDQQLELGREMGMVLADASDVTFTLPEVHNSYTVENQTFSIAVSGELTQIAAQDGQRTFKLDMSADFAEVQQNIGELLHSELDAAPNCGERLTVRNAALVPAAPASVLSLQLHYERWSCAQISGRTGSQELAESDVSVQMKLVPAVDKEKSLKLTTDFSRIDAPGAMGDSLRTGSLGTELREKVSQAMLAAIEAGVSAEKSLPPAIRGLPSMQNARFQEFGLGRLGLVLESKLEASDTQVAAMASQLNQATLAKGGAGR